MPVGKVKIIDKYGYFKKKRGLCFSIIQYNLLTAFKPVALEHVYVDFLCFSCN